MQNWSLHYPLNVPARKKDNAILQDHVYPCFARGVRLRWDKVRKRHMLLFPEGALALNSTAAEVLELCDGKRSVRAIAAKLESCYQGGNVMNDVLYLLSRLAERGLLVFESEIQSQNG